MNNIPKADLSKSEIIINKCREDAPFKSCAECNCTVEECIECQPEAEKDLKENA